MFYRLISLFVATYCFACGPALAERRVALVLGNGAYKHAVKLPNPTADAEAMADLLKSMGFQVVLGTDLGRDAMAEKMSDFANLAGTADVALFFYAGHGMQIGGKNLMIPIDADLKSELDAKVRTIEVDQVLQDTMADAKVKIVLLDACRDNPFAKQIQAAAPKTRSVVLNSGLAEMRPGKGALIAFATGPGQLAIDGEAKHSPFTRALLAHMATPGLEIRHALTRVRSQVVDETKDKQLPWENTNLTGYFYMAKADGAASPDPADLRPTANAPVAGGFDPRTLEIELWNAVKSSNSADEYKSYLERYPNGTFSDLARSRIAAIGRAAVVATPEAARTTGAATAGVVPSTPADGEIKKADATSASEDALGLDRDDWRDIQARLTGLGYSTRGTDGRPGDGTRKGLTAWQSARGYPSSGYLNRLQRDALLREAVPQQTTRSTASSKNSDGDDEKPTRRRASGSSGSSGNSSGGPDAAAAGAFIGGVLRGASGIRLPF